MINYTKRKWELNKYENKIALLGGDGIGPAVIDEGVKILNAIEKNTEFNLNTKEH